MDKKERLHDKESPEIKRLVQSWGWSYPKEEIIEMARLSNSFLESNLFKNIVDLDVLSEDEIASFEARSEDLATKDLDWFCDRNESIQKNRQKILALSKKKPFYNIEAPELSVHPILLQPDKTSADCHVVCDDNEAILMQIQKKKPVLVFSDVLTLKEYSHRGRQEKLIDPILKNISDDLCFAVGEKTQILAKLQGLKKNTIEAEEDQKGDDVWYAHEIQDEVQRMFARFVDEAIDSGATDISIIPLKKGGARVQMRLYGVLQHGALLRRLTTTQADSLVRFLRRKSGSSSDGSRIQAPEDGQFTYNSKIGEVYVRCSFMPTSRVRSDTDMVSASLRLLPKKVEKISLASLAIDEFVMKAMESAVVRSQGLIVLAGPTNSGKSTTCGGLLGLHQDIFGETFKRLSIEDPVERLYPGILQISVPAQLRDKEDKFAIIMKSVLRHDPDVIMLGEVRDESSAGTCIRAAASGHLVFTTLHANDVVTAWELLANYAHEKDRMNLAQSLSLIISQRLVKKLCPFCKNDNMTPTMKDAEHFAAYCHAHDIDVPLPEKISTVNEKGCGKCHGGYSGVYPIHELLPVTREVKSMFVRRDAESHHALYTKRTLTLMDNALKLVNQGKIGIDEVFI